MESASAKKNHMTIAKTINGTLGKVFLLIFGVCYRCRKCK